MFRVILFSLVLTLQLGSQSLAQPITKSENVIAIYANGNGRAGYLVPRLIACVWNNGSAVWSKDQVEGGAPYYSAQLDPAQVKLMLEKLDAIGVFDVPSLKRTNYGPDASFTTVLVRKDGKELKMNSWHEIFEAQGDTVAAERGVTGLNGKKLIPVLATQSAEHLHYRMTWLELRLAVQRLISKSGKEAKGKLSRTKGELAWEYSVLNNNR